jgi:hypothetical protein
LYVRLWAGGVRSSQAATQPSFDWPAESCCAHLLAVGCDLGLVLAAAPAAHAPVLAALAGRAAGQRLCLLGGGACWPVGLACMYAARRGISSSRPVQAGAGRCRQRRQAAAAAADSEAAAALAHLSLQQPALNARADLVALLLLGLLVKVGAGLGALQLPRGHVVRAGSQHRRVVGAQARPAVQHAEAGRRLGRLIMGLYVRLWAGGVRSSQAATQPSSWPAESCCAQLAVGVDVGLVLAAPRRHALVLDAAAGGAARLRLALCSIRLGLLLLCNWLL